MGAFIIGLVLGAIVASVGWFFVWRNNKVKFGEAVDLLTNLNKEK